MGALPWHGDPWREEGDQEDGDHNEWERLKTTAIAPTPYALWVYASLLRATKMPAIPFKGVYSIPSQVLNNAMAMAEIGVVQQMQRVGGIRPSGSQAGATPQPGGISIGDVPGYVWQGIAFVGTVAAIIWASPGGPGGKANALRLASKYPYYLVSGDLVNQVSKMLERGILPQGEELVQEKIPEQWYNQHLRSRYMHGSSPGG